MPQPIQDAHLLQRDQSPLRSPSSSHQQRHRQFLDHSRPLDEELQIADFKQPISATGRPRHRYRTSNVTAATVEGCQTIKTLQQGRQQKKDAQNEEENLTDEFVPDRRYADKSDVE